MFDFPFNFPGIDNSDPQQVLDYIQHHPEIREMYSADTIDKWIRILQQHISYQKGESSAQDLLGTYGNIGGQMSPEIEKWLDNEISKQATEQQQSYETKMRDTSLLSSGSQLTELGLSPSSVVQVGGASSGVNSTPADTNMHSLASLHQQAKINRFNQQMGLAKSLIGAAGQMASSGVYGAAIGAVKHSAQSLAGAAAHSAHDALSATKSMGKFKASDLPKMPSQKVGGFYSIFE